MSVRIEIDQALEMQGKSDDNALKSGVRFSIGFPSSTRVEISETTIHMMLRALAEDAAKSSHAQCRSRLRQLCLHVVETLLPPDPSK